MDHPNRPGPAAVMNTARATLVNSLSLATQRELVAKVREVCRLSPLVRPHTPGGKPMRVRVTAAGELGWVGDGAYRYDATDSRGRPWPAMPELWRRIANDAAGEHPWDSAIVNWYAADAALGWHRDQAERDTGLPIVTISLGDAASWAVRPSEDAPISRWTIQSGDVTLLKGPTRGYLHSIERIIAEPLLSPLPRRGRISITLRVAGAAGGAGAAGAAGVTASTVRPADLVCSTCREPMPEAVEGATHWTQPTTGAWRTVPVPCGAARSLAGLLQRAADRAASPNRKRRGVRR